MITGRSAIADDLVHLVGRQAVGAHPRDAELGGDVVGGRLRVAREHHRLVHAEASSSRSSVAPRVLAQAVAREQRARVAAVDGHVHGELARRDRRARGIRRVLGTNANLPTTTSRPPIFA